MNFTTKVPITKSNHLINYDSKIVSLGSCFAVNIAEKFNYYKFQHTVNPFGILFHPIAIREIIKRTVHQDFYTEADVFFHNERWHCFDAHSDLSANNQQDLLQKLNQNLEDLKTNIEAASHILITYGTAWVYREKAFQKIVANCHKVPQSQFEKELLSIESIQEAIRDAMTLIQSINPKAAIIFTVSPVRHLKDGFTENQRSKAHLIAAIHQMLEAETTAAYFPSYEIMMDELRDYRFYAEDMMHPNATAIEYIWEQFASVSIVSECLAVMEEVESIQKGLAHRPFNPDSASHLKFTAQLQLKIAQLQKRFPKMTF
ncbi:GSCFA domain-containing protein [Flavobacterium sp.]|uniref:GSCFA domain-containing protein n=1 Tax=Flavobacterium sp. TaxID=239 RepID=UPI002603DEC9|nr:GSCFA domain-containing protein [Flavobacterium sp.]